MSTHWSTTRQRVRCISVETDFTPDSKCRVAVELEWSAGTRVGGVGTGHATREGLIIAAAKATLEAIGSVTGDKVSWDFRGAKAVKAFDSQVVVVAVRSQAKEKRYDLLGCCAVPDDDVARGGVLGVLDATNRILERYASG